MKIVVCSDNHNNREVLNKILQDNYNADYYFHLGDSEMTSKEIEPFISVKGNTDRCNDFPLYRVIEIGSHNILLLHSNNDLLSDFAYLAYLGHLKGCDVVLFGHAHRFYDMTINGVRLINPGSCSYNRDGSKPSYVLLSINNNDDIILTREFIDNK